MLEKSRDLIHQTSYFRCNIHGNQISTEGLSECILGHQIDRGAACLPDGIFIHWRWDGDKLTVKNDRYGMYPAFYYATDTEFIISTSIFQLIEFGAPTDINWPGLGAFLRIGFYIGSDTVFKYIYALPPAATLTWSCGKISIERVSVKISKSEISQREAIDSYIDLFRAAIGRRIPDDEQVAMPLSGGRDSRHILYELARLGRKPRYCITGRRYPPDRNEDELIAAKVAQAVDVPHVLVGPPPNQVDSYIKANIKTNMTAPRRGWKLAIVDRLSQDTNTSYDGIGGDMLSGGSALRKNRVRAMESGKYEEFCRVLFGNTEKWLRRMMPAEQVDRMTDDIVIEHLLPEIRQHTDAVNPTTSFYFWNRTRRFDSTNPYGMLREIDTVYSPFLDHDLVDFLLSLDISFNTGSWFHDAVIEKAFPEYKDIPYENPNSPLARSPAMTFRTSRDLTVLALTERPHYLLKRSFLWPHILMRMTSLGLSTYGASNLPFLIYLLQLGSVVNKHHPGLAAN